MRGLDLDLAVQAHGGGGNSNPFLLRLGARHTVGTAAPGAPRLERNLPYRYFQHETQRWLEVAALAGAPAVQLEARLRGRGNTRPRPGAAPRLVVHPGATDPRRRWPVERFAEVAAAVAGRGVEVVVVGDASDRDAAAAIVAHAADPRVTSLADAIGLPALVDLLEDSDVVLANDSGPRHVAMAVGTATVGVFWAPNMVNAAPVARRRHRAHPCWTNRCPRCGAPLAAGRRPALRPRGVLGGRGRRRRRARRRARAARDPAGAGVSAGPPRTPQRRRRAPSPSCCARSGWATCSSPCPRCARCAGPGPTTGSSSPRPRGSARSSR